MVYYLYLLNLPHLECLLYLILATSLTVATRLWGVSFLVMYAQYRLSLFTLVKALASLNQMIVGG